MDATTRFWKDTQLKTIELHIVTQVSSLVIIQRNDFECGNT